MVYVNSPESVFNWGQENQHHPKNALLKGHPEKKMLFQTGPTFIKIKKFYLYLPAFYIIVYKM